MDTDRVILLLAVLTVVGHGVLIVGLGAAVAGRFGRAAAFRAWIAKVVAPSGLHLALVVAAVAMGGSLFLSGVAHFPPCHLCWYQRIAMYPLVPLLLVAAVRRDHLVWRTVWALPAIGSVISIYHYQLERFPDQSALACDADVPCSVSWVWKFHYISVPLMALTAFALIALFLWLDYRTTTREEGAHTHG